MVLYAALRIGKPDEVSGLLIFTLRTIPGEISLDTMQTIDGSNEAKTDLATIRQTTPRKRSRESVESSRSNDKIHVMSESREAITAMVPPKRKRLAQNAEDASSILKAISSAEEIIKSSTIPEVRRAAEEEINNLLKDLNKLRER
jgi:uncharacterized membrane protein